MENMRGKVVAPMASMASMASMQWGDGLPNSVMIDATRYAIETTNEKIILDGRECSGDISYWGGKIRVDASTGDTVKQQILMHEIVHGIMYSRGLGDYRTDEKLVEQLASGFINLIRTNPELVRCIVGGNDNG